MGLSAQVDGATGWPFLVARGRRTPIRTLLAPPFLVEARSFDVLARSIDGADPAGAGARIGVIDDPAAGSLSIGCVSERLTLGELAGGAADGRWVTDEHGRPIELIYGVVSRATLSGRLRDEDVRAARTHVLETYRRLLDDEQRFDVEAAPAIALGTPASGPAPVSPPAGGVARARASRRAPGRRLALAVAGASLAAAIAAAIWLIGRPTATADPLTAAVAAPPQLVATTDRHRHLVYELVVTNTSGSRIRIDRLEVRDGAAAAVLATVGAREITRLVARPAAGARALTIGAGGKRVLFLDVRLASARRRPQGLAHRIVATVLRDGDRPRSVTIDGVRTALDGRPPVRVALPLRGSRLLVADGPAHAAVRLEAIADGGRLLVARRFALELRRLVADGAATHDGAGGRSASYAVFGDQVLASAPGNVVALHATEPDAATVGRPGRAASRAGNYVLQDIGDGRFVLYGGLRRGSVRVRVGQRVARGQPLARVGSSSDARQPGLRLWVMDGRGGASRLAADGRAFVFERFVLWQRRAPAGGPPRLGASRRVAELPRAGDVLSDR